MNKIKNYNQFILESILHVNSDLKEMLNVMESPVAIKFKELIGKDIKTKFNLLKPHTSKLIYFTNDSNLKSVKNPEDYTGKFDDSSIGRIVRKILLDNNINDFNDTDIEYFVNEFKYLNDSYKDKYKNKIKIVSGEDIRKYYNESNYEGGDKGENTLSKSCMREQRCQKYLQVYVDNPDKIKMVVLFGSNNKIRARALLWKTDIGYYLDRIYYTSIFEKMTIIDWVKENVSKNILLYPNKEEMYVELKNAKIYEYYPYLDTFKYYIPSKGFLSYNYNVSTLPFHVGDMLLLDDTFGGFRYALYDDKYFIDDEDISDYYNPQ
jgi:hypothetical protein